MEKIRVAIAASETAPVHSSRALPTTATANPADDVPGLMHVMLGDYHVSEHRVRRRLRRRRLQKSGSDLAKAIEGGQNNTIKFADVPTLGVTVQRGPTMDGLNKYYRAAIEESPYEARGCRTRPSRLAARQVFVLVPSRWLRGCPALLRAMCA